MRVWAIMYDAGMGRIGVLGLATDETFVASMREQGDHLLRLYELVEGQKFTKVASPEPYYADGDRVYRCGWLTLWARPFKVEIPEIQAQI